MLLLCFNLCPTEKDLGKLQQGKKVVIVCLLVVFEPEVLLMKKTQHVNLLAFFVVLYLGILSVK